MTGDARMFNSINTNGNDDYESITFGDNGKGKVKGLSKIAISNDMSISNVLLVESLNFNLLSVAQLCDLGFKYIFGVEVALMTMNMIKWLAHHLNPMIKQVQAIKFQSSNQPMLQEIIHWTLSLVIFLEVYK